MKISFATLILTLCLLPVSAAGQSDLPKMQEPAGAQEGSFTELEGMVEFLQERLQEDPDNLDGWLMLARSYAYMEQPAKAAEAFGQARQQFGDSPELLTSEAEYLMQAAGGKVDENTEALVTRALEMRPDFSRALWLAGIAHYQRKEYGEAGKLWQQLLDQLAAGSESKSMVQEALDDLADRGVSLDQPEENGPGDP